jgi:hypothetical protein
VNYPTVEMILATTGKGFRKELWPGDLDAAISFLYKKETRPEVKKQIKLKRLHWITPRQADPADYFNFSAAIGGGRYGWGKGFNPKILAQDLSELLERPGYFKKLMEFRGKNQIPPVITINGQLADGLGRAALFHALGEPILVADFRVSIPFDDPDFLRKIEWD